MFRRFEDFQDYLEKLGLFHMDLRLGRVERSLRALDLTRPDKAVQVVGTNGKGSVCAFLEALALAHGLSVGVTVSPHFVSPTERIRLDGRPLDPERATALANRVLAAEGGAELTYFELLTVMAATAFEGCDLAVYEAGLGGAHDATTALPRDAVCFTAIALDHQHILGETIEAIADDKARALSPGMAALSGPQVPQAAARLEARAHMLAAELHWTMDTVLPPVALSLSGPHQAANARTALAAFRLLSGCVGPAPDLAAEAVALQHAFIPGRFQRVRVDTRDLILDGAHNAHAMEALAAACRALDTPPAAAVFACFKDKRPEFLCRILRNMLHGPVILPRLDYDRYAAPEDLAAMLDGEVRVVEGFPAALKAVEALEDGGGMDGPVLVCGSLYLLGEFFRLHPRFLEPPRP